MKRGITQVSTKVNVVPTYKRCRDPGSNWGPSDLQSDALPTELSRLGYWRAPAWGQRFVCATTHHPPSRPRGSTVSFSRHAFVAPLEKKALGRFGRVV